MTQKIFMILIKLYIMTHLFICSSYAVPLAATTEMAKDLSSTGANQIEWALLYEGAAYRHDLYLRIGTDPLTYLATNPSGTGSLPGCGLCSYPNSGGVTEITNINTGVSLDFILQINQSQIYFSSGSAAENPDGLAHAWHSNFAGFDFYKDLPGTSSPDLEDTSLSNIMAHFISFPEVMAIINDPTSQFIGFEDLFNGGDLDYNDLIFTYRFHYNPAPIAEPRLIWLLIGMIFYSIWSIRKTIQSSEVSPVKIKSRMKIKNG